ncbi:MAG: 1,4-alpha-glucan branching protein GlgB [Clostridiales bacterium]|nr:1,4-alpha-glucan branching protein GlgB [Clostridiales bacterium]
MMDHAYLFNRGEDYMVYNFLGAHPTTDGNGNAGYVFRVWAPKAYSVSVIGDFNDWEADAAPMFRLGQTGVWETTVMGARQWDRYKYRIIGADQRIYDKGDPYARHFETRPNNASILYDPNDYEWGDQEYRKNKPDALAPQPINIYEIHLGSWRKHPDGNFFSYKELAIDLVDYCRKMNYTHIELMPILEHPLDASWGYQVTGYYAVTSRFGTPADFKYFVDILHQNGISIILDWVPAHFPKNLEGLVRFDGTPCYEYSDPRIGEHREWGTYVFDYSKNEVISFLISNAIFWLNEFHIDGLRVDAVSSMLYRDYGRQSYIPNKYGGNENLEAIEFFKKLNGTVRANYPSVMMIAEESTAWPKVSHPVEEGGLGFTHKWNMGWMHDTLDYFSTDSYARGWHHDQFCFSMMYAFSENYVLSLSHDEVVHGKYSLIDKMPGDVWRKFASLRTLFLYQMSHPGAKLNFMGAEFGQFIEWRFYEELQWFMLDFESHRLLQDFCSKLNRFYIDHPQLWRDDHTWSGFEWIDASDTLNNVFVYARKSPEQSENDIYVALNMVPQPLEEYKIPVYELGTYKLVMNTDDMSYGGSGYPTGVNPDLTFEAIDEPYNGKPYHVAINIPPLAGIYFMKVADPVKPEAPKKTASKKAPAKKTATGKTAKKAATAAKKDPGKSSAKKSSTSAGTRKEK